MRWRGESESSYFRKTLNFGKIILKAPIISKRLKLPYYRKDTNFIAPLKMHFLRSKSTVDSLTVFHAFRRKPSLQWVPLRGKYPPFSSKLKQAKFKAISLHTPFLYKSCLLYVLLSIAIWVQLCKELRFIWILCKRLCFSQFRLLGFIFYETLVKLNIFLVWIGHKVRTQFNKTCVELGMHNA